MRRVCSLRWASGMAFACRFSTNGAIIWHLGTRPARRISRPIRDFHTPEAISSRFNDNAQPAHDWRLTTAPEQIRRLRPYKRDCIVAVEGAIVGGKCNLMVGRQA